MRRKLARAVPVAVAVAALLSPLGAATASAGPAAAVTGSVDQPLDYGPPGTVPTGRIAPPPSDAEQQAVLSRPVTSADQPKLVPYFYP